MRRIHSLLPVFLMLLAGCAGSPPPTAIPGAASPPQPPTAATTRSPSTVPSPTATPSPASSPSASDDTGTITLGIADKGRQLVPGRYSLPDAFAVPFTITLPSVHTLEAVNKSDVQLHYTQAGAQNGSPWIVIDHVANVYADPCHIDQGPLQPPVPSTVEAFIGALSQMRGFKAGPVTDVVVGGHPGKHVVLTNSVDTETAQCTGGGLIFMWKNADGTDGGGTNGGARDEIWMVDLGGTLVVIDGETFQDTPAGAADDLQLIVRSITFD